MLVLSRKPKETIQIGDDITVTILNFNGGAVRIGIDAPKDVIIKRGQSNELLMAGRIKEELRKYRSE